MCGQYAGTRGLLYTPLSFSFVTKKQPLRCGRLTSTTSHVLSSLHRNREFWLNRAEPFSAVGGSSTGFEELITFAIEASGDCRWM